jgi:hypothetical protein
MMGNKPNTVGHAIRYFLLGEGTREGGSLSLMTADVNRPVVFSVGNCSNGSCSKNSYAVARFSVPTDPHVPNL